MATIKILQWNVWYHEKYKNIVDFIKKSDADIVCCQELTVNFQEVNPGINVPEEIARACRYNYFFKPTTIVGTGGEELQMGNGIFSRFPITNKQSLLVQKAGSFPEAEDRAYVEVDIDIDGKRLKVGTVHLSYAPAFVMTKRKSGEAEKLNEIVQSKHEKFILSGDLNATPDSPIVRSLEELFIHADPNTDRPTWTTKPMSYQGFEANSLDWRLDYIFATEDINVISNKIIDTSFSDHLPILAEVEV